MALTDADRMQMALMAVMRHNVVTIKSTSGGGGGGYYGELSVLLPGEGIVLAVVSTGVNPGNLSAELLAIQTVVVIAATWPFANYLLL